MEISGFYASFKADEHWPATCGLDFSDTAQMLKMVQNRIPEWSPIWEELLKMQKLLLFHV